MEHGHGCRCTLEKDGTDPFLSSYCTACCHCCCDIFRCVTAAIFPCITIENTQQISKIKLLNLVLIYPQKRESLKT